MNGRDGFYGSHTWRNIVPHWSVTGEDMTPANEAKLAMLAERLKRKLHMRKIAKLRWMQAKKRQPSHKHVKLT
jgi:hypothetical protein